MKKAEVDINITIQSQVHKHKHGHKHNNSVTSPIHKSIVYVTMQSAKRTQQQVVQQQKRSKHSKLKVSRIRKNQLSFQSSSTGTFTPAPAKHLPGHVSLQKFQFLLSLEFLCFVFFLYCELSSLQNCMFVSQLRVAINPLLSIYRQSVNIKDQLFLVESQLKEANDKVAESDANREVLLNEVRIKYLLKSNFFVYGKSICKLNFKIPAYLIVKKFT